MRPPKLCSAPGCPELSEVGKARGAAHRQKGGRAAGSATYSEPLWRRIRRQHLREHRTCVVCGGPAVIVDHIRPRVPGSPIDPRPGGPDHESNLQSLCRRDHGRKGAKFDGVFGNRRKPFDLEQLRAGATR